MNCFSVNRWKWNNFIPNSRKVAKGISKRTNCTVFILLGIIPFSNHNIFKIFFTLSWLSKGSSLNRRPKRPVFIPMGPYWLYWFVYHVSANSEVSLEVKSVLETPFSKSILFLVFVYSLSDVLDMQNFCSFYVSVYFQCYSLSLSFVPNKDCWWFWSY